MVKAIFFDAAGTLFRVRGSVGEAYAAVAGRHGVRVGAARIEERFRAAFRAMPPMCFPGAPESDLPRRERAWWQRVVVRAFAGSQFEDFDAFFDDLFEHFAQPESWELFPDVTPALQALKARGLRLAVVSNFDGRLVRICTGLGIADYFDAIVMSGHVGCAKPDPRIFAIALQRVGVSAAQAVHVGDSPSDDLEGATAAGLRGILIQRGMTSSDTPDRVPDLHTLLHRC
jgi:putative hydrolase of the HAD superfamily